MRVKSALLVAVLASMLGGCWLQPGADAHRDGANPVPVGITPSNVATLHPAWSHLLSASGALDPIMSQNRVEVTDGVSAFSLDLATGNEVWHHTIAVPPNQDAYSYVTAVTVRGNSAMVPYNGFDGGGTHAYDVGTGAQLADVNAGGAVPVIANGNKLVGAVTGHLGAVSHLTYLVVTDVADPAQGWSTLASGSPTSAAVGKDRFVVGLDNTLAAYPTAHQVCPEPTPNVPVCSPMWTATLNGTARTPVLSADEQTVFTSTSTGWVYAIDASTGATRWSGSVNATAPVALGPNLLYVVSAGQFLSAVDPAGCGTSICTPTWTATLNDQPTLQPAIAGGLVFVAGPSGSIQAYGTDGCGHSLCDALWSYAMGSAATGAPAVDQGHLIVGTADGNVRAFVPS
jgi:outer membrane protein assembly factor BamB